MAGMIVNHMRRGLTSSNYMKRFLNTTVEVDCKVATIFTKKDGWKMIPYVDIICGNPQRVQIDEPIVRINNMNITVKGGMPIAKDLAEQKAAWRPDHQTGIWVPEGYHEVSTVTTNVMKSPDHVIRINLETATIVEDSKPWWPCMEELPDLDRINQTYI